MTTTILIGNPGVGKSTILNCLLGRVAEFHSGVCFGGGLSKLIQVFEAPDGSKFVDTPGLSNTKMMHEAATEIEKALRSGGTFKVCTKREFIFVCIKKQFINYEKVFFVLTLEAGRVRPDDKTTMKLVLSAAPEIGSDYSIIINKLPPSTVQKLHDNDLDRRELITTLNDGLPGTTSFYYNMRYSELEDATDKIIPLDPNLLAFINFAKPIFINPQHVNAIEYNKYEKIKSMLSKQLEEMKMDNKLMRRKMEEQEQRFLVERQWWHQEKLVQEKRFQQIQQEKQHRSPMGKLQQIYQGQKQHHQFKQSQEKYQRAHEHSTQEQTLHDEAMRDLKPPSFMEVLKVFKPFTWFSSSPSSSPQV